MPESLLKKKVCDVVVLYCKIFHNKIVNGKNLNNKIYHKILLDNFKLKN